MSTKFSRKTFLKGSVAGLGMMALNVCTAGAASAAEPAAAAADSFAPRRERFFCLRRPHFFQQRKKWGKERRQKLRFCTSSARYACSLPPALSLT